MDYNPYEQACLNEIKKCMKENPIKTNNFGVDIGASYNSFLVDLPLRGILIDKDPVKVNQHNNFLFKNVSKFATVNNIKDIFRENNVPEYFYIMNIDIDADDFFIMMSLLKEYRPKIIQTEINERIPPPVKFSIKSVPNFDWGWCHLYGYSIACLEDLMIKYNYSLYSLTLNNVILVRNDHNESPNIGEIKKIYENEYLYNKVLPPPHWNDDVKHLHDCKSKEEVAQAWRQYFLDNKNPNNGTDQSKNINNYVINESYDNYFQNFMNEI